MKRTVIPFVLILGTLGLAACNQRENPVSLQFKYEPGMSFPYRITDKIITRTYESDRVINDVATELLESGICEVTRMVDDSIAEIVLHGEARVISIDKGKPLTIDTISSENVKLYHFARNGSVVYFDIPSDTSRSRTDYMKRWLEQAMPVFPVEEVVPGSSWTQADQVTINENEFGTSTTYRIKSFVREHGHDCAVIEYDGHAVIQLDPMPTDSTNRRGFDRIKTAGLMYFAYAEGLLLRQTESYVIDSDRTLELNGETFTFRNLIEGNAELSLLPQLSTP